MPGDFRAGADGEAYWTGRSLFSELLPEGLDMEFTSEAGDTVVVVQN